MPDVQITSVVNTPNNEIASKTFVASAYQALDSDLTTIAGLTPTTDNFIQSKSGAWASRTLAQVKTDLGINNLIPYTGAIGYVDLNGNDLAAGNAYFNTLGVDGGFNASSSLVTSSTDMEIYAGLFVDNHSIFYNTLAVNGNGVFRAGFSLGFTNKSANYTVTASDYTINCTSGTFTLSLPSAVGLSGQVFVFKNSGTGVITVDGSGSQTIDGALTQTLNQWNCITIQSNNANWVIISSF